MASRENPLGNQLSKKPTTIQLQVKSEQDIVYSSKKRKEIHSASEKKSCPLCNRNLLVTATECNNPCDLCCKKIEPKLKGHIHDCQTWYIQDFDIKALEANYGKPLPLYQKALCELTAGAIGECVRSPADLALIHMQAPDSHVFYILMTNIYSSKERWIERAETIRLMKKVGVAKDTGTSWIEMECIALVMYNI